MSSRVHPHRGVAFADLENDDGASDGASLRGMPLSPCSATSTGLMGTLQSATGEFRGDGGLEDTQPSSAPDNPAPTDSFFGKRLERGMGRRDLDRAPEEPPEDSEAASPQPHRRSSLPSNIFSTLNETVVSQVMLKKGILRRPPLGLHEAIQRGQIAVVAQICSDRVGQRSIDESGLVGESSGWNETPLMVACQAYHLPRKEQLDLIEILLRAGARMDLLDKDGRSPLALAVYAAPSERETSHSLNQTSPHWMERGDSCLVRDPVRRHLWHEGNVLTCFTQSLQQGGMMMYDVRTEKKLVKGVMPADICPDKAPRASRKVGLGDSVIYRVGKCWWSGVVTASNPRGGFDVMRASQPFYPNQQDDAFEKTKSDNAEWERLLETRPDVTYGLRCTPSPDIWPPTPGHDPLRCAGLSKASLRFPITPPSQLRPATEGQLYPGASVAVFLPNWTAFRQGMIQGRNTLQGGYNVLLREQVDPATGNLVDAAYHWVDCLMTSSGKDIQGAFGAGMPLKGLGKLSQMRQNPPTPAGSEKTRLLSGVHIEWISTMSRESVESRTRVAKIIQKLCRPRRLGSRGYFMSRDNFDSAERWQKQASTERRVHQGLISPSTPLSGSQVVALCTKRACMGALKELLQMKLIQSKRDVFDWVEGKEVLNLITDPDVLMFFLDLHVDFKLARAVRLAGCVSKAGRWLDVIKRLLDNKNNDPFFWTAASPKGNGLSAVGWACTFGRCDILELLMHHEEARGIARQPHRASQDPLFLTTKSKVPEARKLKMCEILLNSGVSVLGSRALISAVEEAYLKLIAFFLQNGADPTQELGGVLPQQVATNYLAIRALITHASANGKQVSILPVTIVRRALSFDKGGRDREGWLELLNEVTGDWNAWDASGNSALSLATQAEDVEVVRMLLLPRRCNPNVRTAHGEYPIGLACLHNQGHEVAKELLRSSCVFLRGTLALPRTCQRGHEALFNLLLEHDASHEDEAYKLDFEECLHSDEEGARTLAELLLEHPGVDSRDGVVRGMVMQLARLRAMVRPADIARHGWHDVLTEVLTRDGVLVAPVPTPGQISALMYAIAKGDCEMVEFLVLSGADLMQTDNRGRGVLVLALESPLQGDMQLAPEDSKNNVRFLLLEQLLSRGDALSLIKGGGVLAAAARRNHYDAIVYLNSLVDSWCEEDEMVICDDTKSRVSPVTLASDQRVQRLLIQECGFLPNIADLAKCGKFRLVELALRKFEEQQTQGTTGKARTNMTWATICTQKSTSPSAEQHDGCTHTQRTALGWILPKRFTPIVDMDVVRGITAFRYIGKAQRELWGIESQHGYIQGTARVISGWEEIRLDPATPEYCGLMEWQPLGLDHVEPMILPVHELLFKKESPILHRGRAVLIRRDSFGITRMHSGVYGKSPLNMYEKVYIVDVADSLYAEYEEDSNDIHHIPTRYLVTSERVQKYAGSSTGIQQPVEVAAQDCMPYVRVSDVSNEEAADRVLGLFAIAGDTVLQQAFRDEHGVSILELAARGGDLELVKLVNLRFGNVLKGLARPCGSSAATPLERAVAGLSKPQASALCAAVAARQYSVVKYFLTTKRASPADMKQGKSAGKWAASECVMRLLRSHWDAARVGDHLYDLSVCARRGWTNEVEVLLSKPYNADVNKEDSNLSTPLMEAARGGHVELFDLLLQRKAVVDKFDSQGRSVLTVLASLDSKELREPAYDMVYSLLNSADVTYGTPAGDLRTSRAVSVKFDQTMNGTSPATPEISPELAFESHRGPADASEAADAFQVDLKTSFIRRSKALTVAVASNSPNIRLIKLLLDHGSLPNETNAGKTALRHLGCNASYVDDSESVENQQSAACHVLEKLLEWKVQVTAMGPLCHEVGHVIAVGSRGSAFHVKFEIESLNKEEPPKTQIEIFSPSEVTTCYRGPASSGLMSHLDFMHVVSMAWPDVVGLMVDLEAIVGYYQRTLPFICGDSLKEALLQCLRTLGPIWRKEREDGEAVPESSTPPEWNVLRHLLRGLNEAHSYVSNGPSLQQAVNELLSEEKQTLGLIPLPLYKEAIRMCRDDKTFFSELFILHQQRLMKELCESYSHYLREGQRKGPDYDDDFEIFKKLFENGSEYEGAESVLEVAAACGWVDAVKWLIQEKGTSANDTHTANRPIRTVALEVSEQYQDITGQNLRHFMDTCGTLSGAQYVEFMRDRDAIRGRIPYYYANSLNDTILHQCSEDPTMLALVELALLLFANGSNAEPDDLERFSQIIRLDQPFDAVINGEQTYQVSLLHVAAACDNVSSVRWLLDNIAYRDTVGSGVLEDKRGRTARSYTASHACHQVLALREAEQHSMTHYMPPQQEINLVIALKVEDAFNFEALKNIQHLAGSGDPNDHIGVSTVLHALNSLDLAGFVLVYEPDGKEKNNPREVYVAVSGTDKRQHIHANRYPQVRFTDQKKAPLLSKEKLCITSRLVNNFTWPILDLKLQTAVQHLEKSLQDFESTDKQLQKWVRSREWLNYGQEVAYPVHIKVSCRDMQYCGDYNVVPGSAESSPRWRQIDGCRELRLGPEGRWCVYDGDEAVIRTKERAKGLSPTDKFEWQTGAMWKVDQKVFITEGDDKRTNPTWIMVDECSDVVYSLLLDRNPPHGASPYDMTKRLIRVVASLPDGSPEKIRVEASAFPDIEGIYTRDTSSLETTVGWVWVNATADFKLHVSYTRTSPGDPEESVGITYVKPTSRNPGIVSLWTISSHDVATGTDVAHVEMRSDDMAPWHAPGKWVNCKSKTPTPAISVNVLGNASAKKTLTEARELMERKTRAMWSLRQILLASGMPRDTLPFQKVARLQPDVPSVYAPPNLDTPGNLPPGQNWLDLLKQEKKIQQVFGVHSQTETAEILEEWQPPVMPFFFWTWQPFCCISEFLFENSEADLEKKYDPATQTVCDRKTFLSLEPPELHTSRAWDALERLHIAARDTPLFRQREPQYYKAPAKGAPPFEAADTLRKGQGVIVQNYFNDWATVLKEHDEWWLQVENAEGHELLRRMPATDNSSACFYRASYDLPYYRETWKAGRKEERTVAPDIPKLRRESEIEVIYLDLEGKWARVKHHAKAVYFKSYSLPLRSANRLSKTLKPFYLSQLSKLESYLGSKIAFYFAFLSTYCASLTYLLASGLCFSVLQWCLGLYMAERIVLWNAVVVLFWGAYFKKKWVRKTSELTYMWNVRNVEQWEPAMAEFLKKNMKREKKPHPITGLSEPYFTSKHRRQRYLVSLIVTTTTATCVIFVMYCNWLLRDRWGTNWDTKLFFGIANAVTIAIMDWFYAAIAEKLNVYENHRTKSSKQFYAIIKSFLFRFINGFSGLMITVMSDKSKICDCWVGCNVLLSTSLCATAVPAREGLMAYADCPSRQWLDECASKERQLDLMLQLTTQLIIQSFIALLTEKVVPKIILDQRLKRKRDASNEKAFPDKLMCLALMQVPQVSELHNFLTFKDRKFYVTLGGLWNRLRTRQYGGVWEAEGFPGERYRIRQEDNKLYCTLVSTGQQMCGVGGEGGANSPHGGTDDDIGANSYSFKGADENVSDGENSDSLCTSHTEATRDLTNTEIPFPLPTEIGTAVKTDVRGLWTSIEALPTFDRLIVTPDPSLPGHTEPFVIVRKEEVLKGIASPHAKVTMSVEDRRDAGIPQTAVSFVWMYSISDDVDVYLGDMQSASDSAAEEPPTDDGGTKKKKKKGKKQRKKQHEVADKMQLVSRTHSGQAKTKRKIRRDRNTIKLSEMLQNTEEHALPKDQEIAYKMLANGAYAYFDQYGEVVCVMSVDPAPSGEGALNFEDPKQWRSEFTHGLWMEGRFQPVTIPFLRQKGVRWYAWLYPKEEIEGDIAGEPHWKVSLMGSFVYLFDPDSKEEFRPSDPRPSRPPEPHGNDRYFSIRQRQLDTKMTVIHETMLPPVSEENEFEDYTMMMLQFSYVVCFGSVLPLAPLVALLTGCIELHTDVYKYLKLQQRPEATKASGIGAWFTLLNAIIYISVPVNVLIIMKGYGRNSYWADEQKGKEVLLGVLLSLTIVQVLRVVMALMPGTATWVAQYELRRDYERL